MGPRTGEGIQWMNVIGSGVSLGGDENVLEL
jgi:hypothetical protein